MYAQRELQRLVQQDRDIAVIGDETGLTTQGLPPGYIRIRRRRGEDLGPVEFVRSFAGMPYPLRGGVEVHIGRDLEGRLSVLFPTFAWVSANDYDVNILNNGNTRYNWVDLRYALLLLSFAQQPPSLMVSINNARWIDHDYHVHEFGGANVELSGFVPVTGEHRIVVLFLKTDDTIEVVGSTPKLMPEAMNPIGITDLQECFDVRPPGSMPVAAWRLYNDQSAISAHDIYDDLRQWIHIPDPRHTITSVAPSVSNDETIGYGVRSMWVDTISDTVYICVDSSPGAAVWVDISGGAAANILTTKGDLLTRDGTQLVRLPVGDNYKALIADSSESAGLRYGYPLYPKDIGDEDFIVPDNHQVTLSRKAITGSGQYIIEGTGRLALA